MIRIETNQTRTKRIGEEDKEKAQETQTQKHTRLLIQGSHTNTKAEAVLYAQRSY